VICGDVSDVSGDGAQMAAGNAPSAKKRVEKE
jgi:hypothetical protein